MQQEHGGNIRAAAQKYDLDPAEIIDFSANINFLGPPESVLEVIKKNLAGIENYPDPDSTRLKSILAEQTGQRVDNLIVGNGAVELIYLVAKVLQPEDALVLAPTFSEYRSALESSGAVVEEFVLAREEKFELNLAELLPSLAEVDLFCLCNPNNPTAKFLSRCQVKEIIDYAQQHDTYLLIDEAFVDFLEADITVIDLITEYDNLFVLRSLTKFFAIPGLRLGYGAANDELIQQLKASHDPWNVNYLAQLAGQVGLQDKEYIVRSQAAIAREREFLYQKLSEWVQLEVYYPTANYIFVDVTASNFTATSLVEELAQYGILIRNCNTYSNLGEDFVRIAVKSRTDNLQLLSRLAIIFD